MTDEPLIDKELLEQLVFISKEKQYSDTVYFFADKHTKATTYQLTRREMGMWRWTKKGMVRMPQRRVRYEAFRIMSQGNRVPCVKRIANTLRLILFPECSDDEG